MPFFIDESDFSRTFFAHTIIVVCNTFSSICIFPISDIFTAKLLFEMQIVINVHNSARAVGPTLKRAVRKGCYIDCEDL